MFTAKYRLYQMFFERNISEAEEIRACFLHNQLPQRHTTHMYKMCGCHAANVCENTSRLYLWTAQHLVKTTDTHRKNKREQWHKWVLGN